jgi:hypothetical protein
LLSEPVTEICPYCDEYETDWIPFTSGGLDEAAAVNHADVQGPILQNSISAETFSDNQEPILRL